MPRNFYRKLPEFFSGREEATLRSTLAIKKSQTNRIKQAQENISKRNKPVNQILAALRSSSNPITSLSAPINGASKPPTVYTKSTKYVGEVKPIS